MLEEESLERQAFVKKLEELKKFDPEKLERKDANQFGFQHDRPLFDRIIQFCDDMRDLDALPAERYQRIRGKIEAVIRSLDNILKFNDRASNPGQERQERSRALYDNWAELFNEVSPSLLMNARGLLICRK